jgi:tripartite-type tricarboxylate transporter receptor subunit TctC
MLDIGAVIAIDRPAEFAAFIERDHAKWRRVIDTAGITIE